MLATEAMADEVVSEWVKENTIARHPPRRWGKPEEVVTALLYLVSPASAYVTGSEVVADGSLSGAW
jgi:3alpha(or 20beta)-hydroxysteroid dehydrogenase